MERVWHSRDGKWRYAPATIAQWEQKLWDNYGRDCPGLRWQLHRWCIRSGEEAQSLALANLEDLMARNDHGTSMVLIMNYKDYDTTYEALKSLAGPESPSLRRVYVLIGGRLHANQDGRMIVMVSRAPGWTAKMDAK